MSTNPLLDQEGLPRFNEIEIDEIVPAIQEIIRQSSAKLEHIESNLVPSWDGLIKPLEDLERPFEYSWQPVNHLLNVKNSDDLRKAHETILPHIINLGLRINQSTTVYKALQDLKSGDEWTRLDKSQQRAIDLKIRAAKHAGVALEGKAKERYVEISQEISQLNTDFSNNVLDATKAFEHIVEDPAHTEGWPTSLKQLAAQSFVQARKSEESPDPEHGPWRITLDYPSFVPFMQHSKERDQRELVYRAFITRASQGETDNSTLINRILELRREKAQLLGFSSFAELSLDTKMAPSIEEVNRMFEELKAASYEVALKEHGELEAFAQKKGHLHPLMHWDLAYWSERMREELFDFTDEELRPYFPLSRVIDGLFSLCTSLFEITFEQVENESTIWHPDVHFYRVRNEEGTHIASFYLDPYSRPHEKRGGAWMDKCLDRRLVNGELRIPVVHLCCNGTPPVGNIPSLMSFREVETLFHEFGHGLQGMLTTVDYSEVAGINGIEWDAVEIASQFMENWCYHKPTLLGMTAHYETGEPLPDELYGKLLATRTYRAGSAMMRQLLFGAVDIALHHTFVSGTSDAPMDVYRSYASKMAALPPLPEDRFLCAFSHIFAGGYAAGYYSYKWAEVLSADAFEAFEEVGLDNADDIQKLGRKYRDSILALGGSRHPMEVYQSFRGRPPSSKALLRHSGLIESVTNGINTVHT